MDDQQRYQSNLSYGQTENRWQPQSYETEINDGVYYFAGDNEETAHARSGGGRFLALIASFLVVAMVFSLVSAYGMRRYMISMSRRAQLAQSSQAAPQEKAAGQELPEPQTTVAVPLGTNKDFSLQNAASQGLAEKSEALSIMEIAKRGKPSVVAILTEQSFRAGFFETIPVAGSGIIISKDGYIATNNHVVANSQNIKVHLDDGSLYEAKLIGRDPLTDLAVIKIDIPAEIELSPAVFGDSDRLEVGELAVAIGNPSGTLEGSVTSGIISALERNIRVEGLDMTVLQTDASINAGNSGGALYNSRGEVIGINTAKLQSDGSRIFDGIAFAIPVNFAKPILEDLTRHGYVRNRVELGIYPESVEAGMARYLGLADRAGILIRNVAPNSAADKAGLRSGDFIVAIDETDTPDLAAINNLKKTLKAGDLVTVHYFRDGKLLSCEMTLLPYEPEQKSRNND